MTQTEMSLDSVTNSEAMNFQKLVHDVGLQDQEYADITEQAGPPMDVSEAPATGHLRPVRGEERVESPVAEAEVESPVAEAEVETPRASEADEVNGEDVPEHATTNDDVVDEPAPEE
eukprot:4399774-Alexandrium_andersonii.AAC.1